MAALWVLWRHPVGARRPEPLILAIAVIAQVEIAYMIPRVHDSLELYLLGFSLALYASGSLIVWHPRWTASLVGVTWVALAASVLTVPGGMDGSDVLASAFYLSTASAIAILGQVHRHATTQREYAALDRLEQEQQRTTTLLAELERLSNEDALTGLANRRRWDAELARACDDASRVGSSVAVLLVDVDRLKELNDRFGHADGDAALRPVARLLAARVRRNDLAARVGGDEFAVLLVGASPDGAAAIAEELRRGAAAIRVRDGGPAVTLSIGVAAATGDGADPLRLLAAADTELYRAKASRDSVSVGAVAPASPAPAAPSEVPPSPATRVT